MVLVAVAAAIAALGAGQASAAAPSATLVVSAAPSGLGTIRGVVRDEAGTPIADATVAVFRIGTAQLLKQVSTTASGSFIAKVLPGRYTLLAVASGFNPMTLPAIEISSAADLTYGFKLERAGSGNTLPEKKLDRNSSKWRIRAAQSQRSIYQNTESKTDYETAPERTEPETTARTQAVVESFFASSQRGAYQGVNFATLIPVNPKLDLSVIGQLTRGRNTPQRVETGLAFRTDGDHSVKVSGSFSSLGVVTDGDTEKALGQLSVQAIDEWRVKDGVILVLGFDYSRYTGAGDDSSITPRVGLQFEANANTRLRAAFTPQTEERSWADAVDIEGMAVNFREPVAIEDIFISDGKPKMNRSTRFEFGVERILDGSSSIEANAFFDTTLSRGVGLDRLPFDSLGGNSLDGIVADQQGRSAGVRFVYSRRISSIFNLSAGYGYGTGQKLDAEGLVDPAKIFRAAMFQSAFGELDAAFDSGTSVKTVFRLSPRATVFAIDPFKGRLAIYDPGLSVLVTQRLPRFGLPVRAQAIVDARNVFDLATGVTGSQGSFRLDGRQRAVRGGIMVRF